MKVLKFRLLILTNDNESAQNEQRYSFASSFLRMERKFSLKAFVLSRYIAFELRG